MAYLPIFLDLKHRPCLVVGGGKVASQKVATLVKCGARVTVVSPTVSVKLKRWIEDGRLAWRKREFRLRDLQGMELVVVAANDPEIGKEVAKQAKTKGIWVNVVDGPQWCSFVFPSVVRRGRLVLAISTTGASPALARWIRQDLERRYREGYRSLLETAAQWRPKVQHAVASPLKRKRLFQKALKAYLDVLKSEGGLSSS